jgi:hypothetical protein
MPLLPYVQARLQPGADDMAWLRGLWSGLGASHLSRIVRWNLDRECDLDDVDHDVLDGFLRELVAAGTTGSHRTFWDLLQAVWGTDALTFSAPGRPLPLDEPVDLLRTVSLEGLVRHNLPQFAVGPNGPLELALIAGAINGGGITADDLQHAIGLEHHPVWVARSADIAADCEDDALRDTLGLSHLNSGFLARISYRSDLLDKLGAPLRAPTIIDAAAGAERNWLFVKRTSSHPGPDWGNAIHLERCQPVTREAVHEAFAFEDARLVADAAASIVLSVDAKACAPPPQVSLARVETLLS